MSDVIASYFYYDAQRKPVARIDRIEPGWNGRSKEFLPYLSDGSGGYNQRPGLNGVKLPLYHLDELRAAIELGEAVYITEGEGKADELRATLRSMESKAAVITIQGGASAPMRPEHVASLAGASRVVVLADSDESGRRAARSRAQRIADAEAECDVKIVDLYAERDDGGDVANWLRDGGTLKELRSIEDATPRVGQSPRGGALEMDAPEARIITRSLAEIEPSEVRWLWEQRIVRGDFGMIAGLPGVGKSYLCAAIGAALSRGAPLPGQLASEPCDVILLALEDNPESVLRPRFEQLGAELTRVHVIDGISAGQAVEPFSIKHVDLTAELLQRIPRAALIIIDPIASALAGVDTWRSPEVRAALDPLLSLTRSRGVAVLAVGHTTKRIDGHAITKIEGALGGFVGTARYVLGVGRGENGERGVGVLKSNYGPTDDVPVVQYTIDDAGVFSWGEQTTAITAIELFAPPPSEQQRSASGEGRDAIIDALRGGELLADELTKRVRAAGISAATLNRVRSQMHTARKIERLGGGVAGPVRWRLLPIDSQEEPLIRTLLSAKECAAMRKSERGDQASLFGAEGEETIAW